LAALGGTWLSAQNTTSPRDLLVRCLELGFDSVAVAPGIRPTSWTHLAPELMDLPLHVQWVRVDPVLEHEPGTLASAREADRQRVVDRVTVAAELARVLQTQDLVLEAPRVALEPNPEHSDLLTPRTSFSPDAYEALRARLAQRRDAALEHTCRALFELTQELSEFRFLITESTDLCSLSHPDELQVVFEDLRSQNIGYWHRPAVVAKRAEFGGPEHAQVLETLSGFLVGSDLSDYGEFGVLSIPGTGCVDYHELGTYIRGLRSRLPAVLDLDPSVEESDVSQALRYLESCGL